MTIALRTMPEVPYLGLGIGIGPSFGFYYNSRHAQCCFLLLRGCFYSCFNIFLKDKDWYLFSSSITLCSITPIVLSMLLVDSAMVFIISLVARISRLICVNCFSFISSFLSFSFFFLLLLQFFQFSNCEVFQLTSRFLLALGQVFLAAASTISSFFYI